MKILVISQYYYPEQFRITEICEKLASLGNKITVVTGIPNYPKGEIFSGYEKSYLKTEIHNGVEIIRCNNKPRHKGIINLVKNYISFMIEARKQLKKLKEKYDVVYIYQLSPITIAIPAIEFGKKNKIPIYLYCLDIWPESIRELSDGKILSKNNLIYLIVKYISAKIYNSVDFIGVKCNPFSEYLIKECKVKKEKIGLLYEHAEKSYLDISEEAADNKCYDFMFLGNIGYSQNCKIIVEALEKSKIKKKYKLHFIGEGSALEDLKSYVSKSEIKDNIIFHGRVSINEVNKFYEIADCCLLTLSNKTDCGLTLPAKLTSYMAASRPIIAVAEGATKEIIEKSKCGICVSQDEINELIIAMNYVINNKEKSIEMGKNGRKYFKKYFLLENHIENLINDLLKIISCYTK